MGLIQIRILAAVSTQIFEILEAQEKDTEKAKIAINTENRAVSPDRVVALNIMLVPDAEA
jgi:hypothetical protein